MATGIRIDLSISGTKELAAALNSFTPVHQRNIMRPVIRKAAQIVRKDAKTWIPKKSGRLKKSLMAQTMTRGGVVMAKIGPRRNTPGSRYAHIVHGGQKPHSLEPRKKKPGDNRTVFPQHPGTPAVPFLTHGLESAIHKVRAQMEPWVRESVKKHILKQTLKTMRKR